MNTLIIIGDKYDFRRFYYWFSVWNFCYDRLLLFDASIQKKQQKINDLVNYCICMVTYQG